MKLIGYIRVSTDGQRENTSLEEQKRRIEAYCYSMGHKLVGIFEETASAKDTRNRPVFQKALTSLKKADGIVAFKLDRIARNTQDVLTLVNDYLRPNNKALVLLDLNVDTSTPTGMLILTVMAAVAQLERDVIQERTKSGRRATKEKMGYLGGTPPYGFDAVPDESNPKKLRLIPNETEQKIIRVMRNHRRSGKSLREVAHYLNQNGHETKTGKRWQHTTIAYILNPASRAKTKGKAD